MNTKITINPKFKHLENFVNSLPEKFENEGVSIHKIRNEIKIFDFNGIKINVKSYKIPILINRFIYSFIRKSKAERSYEYAQKLMSMGYLTAEPIAHIEEYSNGLLRRSFFVSTQIDNDGDFRCFDKNDKNIDDKKDLIVAFAKYTAKLHEDKIYHKDYSSGNILWKKHEDGSFDFYLIDINRMSFREISFDEACQNFSRLWGNIEFYDIIAKTYAKARGFDEQECLKKIHKYKDMDREKRRRKSKIKDLFK